MKYIGIVGVTVMLTCGPIASHGNPLQSDVPLLFGEAADLVIGDRDEGMVFGNATDIAVGSDGRIYLLDGGFGKIYIFSPDGELLGEFGRSGEGPGEFTIPMCIATDPESGDVWVGNFQGRLCQYTADGEVVDDIRFSWPGNRPVRSIAIGMHGNIYVSCANVLDQTMIHVFRKNGELVRSFGDTFARDRPETDTEDELAYATGFLDVRDSTVFYSQKNPYEIRQYDLSGNVRYTIRDSGQDVPYPPPVRMPDGRRKKRSLKGSWGIMALPDGAFMNNIVIPMSEHGPPGSIIEHYNSSGDLVLHEEHSTLLFVRAVDGEGRVWALDNQPYARMMRYPAPAD